MESQLLFILQGNTYTLTSVKVIMFQTGINSISLPASYAFSIQKNIPNCSKSLIIFYLHVHHDNLCVFVHFVKKPYFLWSMYNRQKKSQKNPCFFATIFIFFTQPKQQVDFHDNIVCVRSMWTCTLEFFNWNNLEFLNISKMNFKIKWACIPRAKTSLRVKLAKSHFGY
jgi:hypothetical protein